MDCGAWRRRFRRSGTAAIRGTIEKLMETLLQRRSRVRELIGQFRESNREPFPQWGLAKSTIVMRGFEAPVNSGRFVN